MKDHQLPPSADEAFLSRVKSRSLHWPDNRGCSGAVIRRMTATCLLLCMALLVPAAAVPVRVCFLEKRALLPGWKATLASDSEKPKCCSDCDGKEEGHCCMEVKKLPDSPEPSAHLVLTPVFFWIATSEVCLSPPPVLEADGPFLPSAPIRGPDLPREWRALLGVWNI